MSESFTIPAERVERRILLVRGQKVMLDFQLAELYEVETKALNQAVKRNLERFPEDFMFQLTQDEMDAVSRSQIVTLKGGNAANSLGANEIMRSQIVTLKQGKNLKYAPYAFTEQGVAMLSSVLRSPRAVQVNIAIMRTFVQMRQWMQSNEALGRKLAALEGKYDQQFKVVFDAIRKLMEPVAQPSKREIGFHTSGAAGSPKARKVIRNRKS